MISLLICLSVFLSHLSITSTQTIYELRVDYLLVSEHFLHLIGPDTVQHFVVYILKGGRGWQWWCGGGGAGGWGGGGHGAKWKHVTQAPLKRNPAQQKKETHIIIKSSRGEAKTTNIIPAAPRTPNTHTRMLTHSSLFFPLDDKEDGMIGAVLCLHTAWEWQEDVWELPDPGKVYIFFDNYKVQA